jgi:hypothetical protein
MGEPYDVDRGYCPNRRPGKEDEEVFTISGWFLLPTDLDTTGKPQVIPSGFRHVSKCRGVYTPVVMCVHSFFGIVC